MINPQDFSKKRKHEIDMIQIPKFNFEWQHHVPLKNKY